MPGTALAASVTFAAHRPASASTPSRRTSPRAPRPGRRRRAAAPSGTPRRRRAPGASSVGHVGSPPPRPPPVDPNAPVRFAVDLFDVDEIDDRARLRGHDRGARGPVPRRRHRGPVPARGRHAHAADGPRRAVGPDRPPRPPRPVRRMGRLPPRRAHPAAARPDGPAGPRAGGRERLMGIAFDAPLALLLLIPALALTVGLHLGARRRIGVRPAAARPRRPDAAARGARLRAGRASSSSCRSTGSPRSSSSTSPIRSATPVARTPSRSCARRSRSPEGDVAGIVAFGKEAPRRAAPGRPDRDRPDRVDAGQVGDRHRRGPAPGHGALPRRRPETDRPALRRQRHDRRRPGRGGPGGRARHPDRDAPDRARRRRRGPHRAAHDAVDGAARRDRCRSSRRSARRSPRPRRSGCSPTAPWSRRKPVALTAGLNTVVRSTSSRPRPASTRSASSSRRRATRSARTTGPTRTRSSRASRGRSSWPATTRSRPSWSPRSRTRASRSTRSSPRRCRPTSRASSTTTAWSSSTCRGCA